MAFQFPPSPTVGQLFTPVAGVTYQWNGTGWLPTASTLTQGQADARYAQAVTGDRTLWQQTTAPVGWTKEVNALYNDAALRFQTGTATTGGADNFSVVFGVGKTTATDGSGNSGGFTLTEAEIPAHTHQQTVSISGNQFGANRTGASGNGANASDSSGANTTAQTTLGTGGGGSHAHTTPAHFHTFSNFNLKFADVIIATKD